MLHGLSALNAATATECDKKTKGGGGGAGNRTSEHKYSIDEEITYLEISCKNEVFIKSYSA